MTMAEQIRTAAAEATPEEIAAHKAAFRVAFDLLKAHWPPENTVEYWDKAGTVFSAEYERMSDNRLARRLLGAVYGYLDTEAKERSGEE